MQREGLTGRSFWFERRSNEVRGLPDIQNRGPMAPRGSMEYLQPNPCLLVLLCWSQPRPKPMFSAAFSSLFVPGKARIFAGPRAERSQPFASPSKPTLPFLQSFQSLGASRTSLHCEFASDLTLPSTTGCGPSHQLTIPQSPGKPYDTQISACRIGRIPISRLQLIICD